MTRLNLFNTNQSINQSFVSTMLTSELGTTTVIDLTYW